ncbi:MAG: cysteine desulfurase family protein [Pseudomonadota bacterium]
MIDLDHNAGTALRPAARMAMESALEVGGNPSSVHSGGRRAKRILEDAREAIAGACAVTPAQIVFTSGGTEANALALNGLRAMASAVEHPCVLAQPGVVAERLPVDGDGRVDLDGLSVRVAASGVDQVAVMAANNETGVLQPLVAVRERLPEGVALHVDAVQAPGRLDLPTLTALADSVALSSHKVGGPPGIGALVLAPGRQPSTLVAGGGQERGRRGGTENVPGAAGFAAALGAITVAETRRVGALRDRLEVGLRAVLPDLRVLGDEVERLPNTTAVVVPGWSAETLVIALDLAGVAVSSGAACSSGKVGRSHVLAAMGVAGDAVRLSLGWSSTEAEVDAALAAFHDVTARRRVA